ncbi:RNA polymerase sigma factor [Flavivirga spongiicola]|uniref:RNA polymerase sigma-70 factor n=1 Tax=Flavivirga spongiicola TaxID=421621 RepID=A0ABU7XYE5_9FLAO|nr:RNA polymerase sigma-70 factor [Flavivirga sp. MEBiC05379]MDO5980814.1 RNA polymerase sigma-70 factor [Flavivirga sp. MEBiC05379]
MSVNQAAHSEKLLVKQVIAGNEKAFIKLYDIYKNKIYGYSLKLLKSRVNAEEMLQDVFMKVWQKRETLDEALSFKSFLYTITRNKCFDFLEKAANDEKMKRAIFYQSQKSFVASDKQVIEADFMRIKREAYESLPPKRRTIFKMSREKGMTYDQIGKELGISTSTVKSQMNKALETLRNYFKEHQDVSFTLLLILKIF